SGLLGNVRGSNGQTLIVDGSLNGTRRESLTDPKPLTPDEIYELSIPMNPTGWVIQPGHRLRLAVSGSDFPNLWPTPEKARNRVYHGEHYPSRVILPVAPTSKLPPPQFLPPPQRPPLVKSSDPPQTHQVVYYQISVKV